MDLTSGTVHDLDADTQYESDAWKDRAIIAALAFGGALSVGWCTAIAGAAVWLIGQF